MQLALKIKHWQIMAVFLLGMSALQFLPPFGHQVGLVLVGAIVFSWFLLIFLSINKANPVFGKNIERWAIFNIVFLFLYLNYSRFFGMNPVLHIYSTFSVFHLLYLDAAVISKTEYMEDKKVSFWVALFSLWFFIFGIWYLQPKLNQMGRRLG